MGITEDKIFQSILIKGLGLIGTITAIGAFAVSFTPLYGVNSIYIGLIALVISSIALYLGFKYNNNSSRGIILIGIITSVLAISFGYYQKRKIDKLTTAIKEPVEKIKKELTQTIDSISEDFSDLQGKGNKALETIKKQGSKQLQEIEEEGTNQLEQVKEKGKEQLKKIQEEGTNAIKNKLKSFLDDDDKNKEEKNSKE